MGGDRMITEFEAIALEIGALVAKKNKAYGDSYSNTGKHLALLYPNGVKVEQYTYLLLTARILDKLSRLAQGQLEDTLEDLTGYPLVALKHYRDELLALDKAAEAIDSVVHSPSNH